MDKPNTECAATHVVVVGGGIVGVTTALELRLRGHEVTLLSMDQPGSQEAASYGNAGWLNPGSVVPLSMPGMWKKIPGYLLAANGPLKLRPSALLQSWQWLLGFVAGGATQKRVRRIARALRPFLADSAARHSALAEAAGVPELIEKKGLLVVYPNKAAYEADALAWSLRRENNVVWKTMERPELVALCPELGERYQYGAFIVDGAHCRSPGGYVAALAQYAEKKGVSYISGCAEKFLIDGGKISGVVYNGNKIACDHLVIAGGMGSVELASQIGDRLPLVSERGYHVEVPGAEGGVSIPVMMSDLKFGITPMTGGLRAAGQVEFALKGAAPDWRRARILLDCLREGLPRLKIGGFSTTNHWMGNRPSTPDCLPVIGPSPKVKGVYYATGHGHLGLVSAPLTAEFIARLIAGDVVPEVAPYTVERFCRDGKE
ncbi:FAD-dependent oxidoreductase [Acetobacter okinawensis]|uniref:NAD(P)/FAD-dependent oxidoreductase n=1 Tax=Acetobacter okinawensis TaxID=1076594 RepID=UPI001BABBCE9|nr:FAD-dependent oxidoreductase [Acetobacter okinawensis]MBS0988309.1 FAD-dependent oxidoreductase [Acetobacter okinawensis]